MRRVHDASASLQWSLLLAICALVSAVQESGLEEIFRADAHGGADPTVVKLSKSLEGSSEEDVSDDLILLTHKIFERQPGEASSEEQLPELTEEPPNPNRLPIDMNKFVTLIPSRQVQGIAAKYYRHDREVQRVFAYLGGEVFAEVRQQFLQLPEMRDFTQFLSVRGFDWLKLANAMVNAVKPPASLMVLPPKAANDEGQDSSKDSKGLHGLVDSVLFVLPQDQILAAFFDKTETDLQFARLVDSIGTPQFAKILSNLQKSPHLRKLIHELHKNRIHLARIVGSFKEYFLLASI